MENFKTVQNYYDAIYLSNKENTFPFDEKRTVSFLKYLSTSECGKNLDIGCGVGYVCDVLQKKGHEVYGIDISNNAIEIAKKRVKNGVFSIANNDACLNFENGYFNSVTCFGVLEHIENAEKITEESYRVLKDNGIAIFVMPNKLSPYFLFRKHGTGQIIEIPRTLKDWSAMLKRAGFIIEKVVKDPGPSYIGKSLIGKIKIFINNFFSGLSVHFTYQFVFILRKKISNYSATNLSIK